MPRPASDIRERILMAARERFLAEGVDGASLRHIAKDAGTNIGMVVYYFRSKDDLFYETVEDVYAKLTRDLEVELAKAGTIHDRIRGASLRLAAMSERELLVARLLLRELLLSSKRTERLVARFRHGHIGSLARLLGEGIEQNVIAPDLPLPLLLVCTVGVVGMPQLVKRIVGSEPPFSLLPQSESLARELTRVLFEGIGARGREGEAADQSTPPVRESSRSDPRRVVARSRRKPPRPS